MAAVGRKFCLLASFLVSYLGILGRFISKLIVSVMSNVLSNDELLQLKWFEDVKLSSGAELLKVQEWQDEKWRDSDVSGFKGRDFCHSSTAAVRIIDYCMLPPSKKRPLESTATTESALREQELEHLEYPRLVGPAHFTPNCESHRGLCHGGSFCALMDDAIGWMGFCVSGTCQPWSGFTVQVNTSLKKAVPVHAVLKLEAWVHRKEGRRKFWIHARLVDPTTDCVHCTGEGLFLLSVEAAAAMMNTAEGQGTTAAGYISNSSSCASLQDKVPF
jgi:acyl-coenzyme A thioesterase PaaI-like protein